MSINTSTQGKPSNRGATHDKVLSTLLPVPSKHSRRLFHPQPRKSFGSRPVGCHGRTNRPRRNQSPKGSGQPAGVLVFFARMPRPCRPWPQSFCVRQDSLRSIKASDVRISPGSVFSSGSNVVSEDEDRERSEAPGKAAVPTCPGAVAGQVLAFCSSLVRRFGNTTRASATSVCVNRGS